MYSGVPLIYCECSHDLSPHYTTVHSPWHFSSFPVPSSPSFSDHWVLAAAHQQSQASTLARFAPCPVTNSTSRPNISKTLKFGIENILGEDTFSGKNSSESSIIGHCSTGKPQRRRPWSRPVFTQLQRRGLEKRFQVQKYITKHDRYQLAAMLGLSETQVKVWFQNRRTKWRQDMKDMERRDDEDEGEGDDEENETDKKDLTENKD